MAIMDTYGGNHTRQYYQEILSVRPFNRPCSVGLLLHFPHAGSPKYMGPNSKLAESKPSDIILLNLEISNTLICALLSKFSGSSNHSLEESYAVMNYMLMSYTLLDIKALRAPLLLTVEL